MAVDVADLLDPAHTVLVTQECQNGVIGEAAVLRDLADEAQRVAVPNIARLVDAARAAGVAVAGSGSCDAGRQSRRRRLDFT